LFIVKLNASIVNRNTVPGQESRMPTRHSFKDITATGKSRTRMRDQVAVGAQLTGAGHRYEKIAISENATVHAGDSLGGKSIFED